MKRRTADEISSSWQTLGHESVENGKEWERLTADGEAGGPPTEKQGLKPYRFNGRIAGERNPITDLSFHNSRVSSSLYNASYAAIVWI